MEINRCTKEKFSVIGKEGSTEDGAGFIRELWREANAQFEEVSQMAKKDDKGNVLGMWGAMSDPGRSFLPWEDNFSKGLYLAGVETVDEANAPDGWVKWTIPAYEYVYTKIEGGDTFKQMINYLNENEMPLVGAVHEFYCLESGDNYMFFPIRKL